MRVPPMVRAAGSPYAGHTRDNGRTDDQADHRQCR